MYTYYVYVNVYAFYLATTSTPTARNANTNDREMRTCRTRNTFLAHVCTPPNN